MEPTVELRLDGDGRPVRLGCRGRLDSATVGPFLTFVGGLLAARPTTLVVEIGELAVADESGEWCLASLESAARRSGTTVLWSGVDRDHLPDALGALAVTVLAPRARRDGSLGACHEPLRDRARPGAVEAHA